MKTFFISVFSLFLLVFVPISVEAQMFSWLQVSDIKPKKIAFVDDNKGYALVNDSLLKTNNGGLTWSLTSDLGLVKDFNVNEQGNIYVLGTIKTNNQQKTALFFSKGGHGWKVVHIFIYDITVGGMEFTENGHGFIGTIGLMKTTDHGRSWRSLLDLPLNHAVDVAFNRDLGFYVDYDAARQEVNLYRTVDLGNTWDYLGVLDYRALDLNSQVPYKVAFGEEAVYLVSGTKILKSVNQGASWETIRQDISDLYDIVFVRDRGFALGKEKIIISDNGGATWREEFFSRASEYNSLSATESYVYAAAGGGVFRSSFNELFIKPLTPKNSFNTARQSTANGSRQSSAGSR